MRRTARHATASATATVTDTPTATPVPQGGRGAPRSAVLVSLDSSCAKSEKKAGIGESDGCETEVDARTRT